jgi:hypothetical protein
MWQRIKILNEIILLACPFYPRRVNDRPPLRNMLTSGVFAKRNPAIGYLVVHCISFSAVTVIVSHHLYRYMSKLVKWSNASTKVGNCPGQRDNLALLGSYSQPRLTPPVTPRRNPNISLSCIREAERHDFLAGID